MRVIIDMQGAQTESRFRGIGRYTLSLVQAIARNREQHDIVLALNGLFSQTIEPIRAAFEGILPKENLCVWYASGPTREADPSNYLRREVAERMREAFLQKLRPDVILITSLVEGLGDDAVTSIGKFDQHTPVVAIVYDLIPLVNPDINFKTNEVYRDWYSRKITWFKRSQMLLAISEKSKREAKILGFDAGDIVNISGACDVAFCDLDLSEYEKQNVYRNAGIGRPFILYTGGADDRKNLYRLIEAYANIPQSLRSKYRLVFIGKIPEVHLKELSDAAMKHGIKEEDIYFAGYIEDLELIKLYNSCSLFVFPSLHEGFGLPPLEAMSCGAPVICANSDSLLEIIDYEEALFDPLSIPSIAAKLEEALTNEAFRLRLSNYGKSRAKQFSWDECGKRALKALSRFDHRGKKQKESLISVERTSLFYRQTHAILILKLDHMGDLLLAVPAITKLKARFSYSTIDIVVGSWNVSTARSLNLFKNIYVCDYFKNSSAEAPFISDVELDELVNVLGCYDIAIDLRRQRDTRFILAKIVARLKVGYETSDMNIDSKLDIKLKAFPDIQFEKTPTNRVHIAEQMLRLIDALPANINDYINLPMVDRPALKGPMEVAIFPTAGNEVKEWPVKNYIALVDFICADERVDIVNIYFSDEKEAVRYDFLHNSKLRRFSNLEFSALVKSLSRNAICVANNSFGAHVASYSGCLVIGLYGGHETISEWAPVFGENYVIHRAAFCSPCHLSKTSDCHNEMFCLNDISAKFVFDRVSEAISSQKHGKANNRIAETVSWARIESRLVDNLINSIAALDLKGYENNQIANFAENIARNHRLEPGKRQLLIDISEFIQRDAKTGIQRVVRGILGHLLNNPPHGFVVEPIYSSPNEIGYRYARKFTKSFFANSVPFSEEDTLTEASSGDIFLGLDLNPTAVQAQEKYLKQWREMGVGIYFVVYDLLPVLMPWAFPEGTAAGYHKWLEIVSHFDGAIAISKSVAEEMRKWLQVFGKSRERAFHIGWFHLGVDVENAVGSTDTSELRAMFSSKKTFLMVGTIEPRKGHAQTLAAFERLWQAGEDVNLIVVGKQGWMVESLVRRLYGHTQLDKRLFWVDNVSDFDLGKIYAASHALIAASEGEGFGLPLIEAARHNLPIIARDIPIFREIAGDHASFFPDDTSPDVLANAICDWLALNPSDASRFNEMPWLTWGESTQQLVRVLIDGAWSDRWLHDGVQRFWGGDPRLFTRVGERRGKEMRSKGEAGNLVYGPYLSLASGQYHLVMRGRIEKASGEDWFDIVCDAGKRELLQRYIGYVPRGDLEITADFLLNEPVTDLEVRLWIGKNADLALTDFELACTNNLSKQSKYI